MVQLMSSGKRVSVKLEVEESLEEELASLHKKRSKLDPCLQEGNVESGKFPISPSLYNPLDEPSPLGLRLKKSPSFLDLIRMKLSQQNADKLTAHNKKDSKGVSVSGVRDKLKASNFPAAILRIGSWEYKSRYEGDLVAKCYFAKHKLVWEVLDGGLKNKIEIQWSDIVAIKANYPDDVPGTLDVVLARQPLFFKETNPQPRKHTLWQATSDFTGGQASVHRQHFLQCPPGLLGKHFEKLIHCDPRLNFLSKQPEILLESPYFESRISGFNGLDDAGHSIELKSEEVPTIFRLQDQSSPSTVQSPSCINEQDFGVRASDNFCQGTPSPSSVREAHVIEEIRGSWAKEWDRINFPELNASMSMTDLVDHIGNCITEQMTASVESQNILEEITQYLLNDSQHTTASDEKYLMPRVNSLYCLLQKDSATEDGSSLVPMDDVAGSKLSHPMSRKDSIGDLLLSLPRIASMPKFLFNTLEDSDIKSRANKAALLAFKKSIFDPKSALTNWIDVVPVCNFSGITCNKQHHRVQEINLSGYGLGGKISPFLSNLTGLRHLKLNENHFYGAIPPELSSLRRLTMFVVMENYLTGSLPPSFFSNCTNLMVIDASVNNFTGQIPDQIGDCPDLWSLNLYNNQFTGELPASLANTSLYSLDVGYNLLSGELPSDLVRKWPYLGNLYLSYNNMTSHDNNTNLYPFFAALRNCSNLSEVGLVGMQLGGRLPTSIAHPTLRLLDLQDNHISGPIPREIGNLTNITMLSLTSNLLNGTIPEEISLLSMLEQLFLSHNFFSSRIPATLSKLNHLGLIDLSSNKFSGEIPPSLGDLGQLRFLFLNNNLLSGSIPPKLLNCRNLNMLDLSYNQLTGRIPPEIAELREIRISINLSHNHLQGLLPIELSKLENVLEMDLSSNNLSGNIFPQISSCIAVTMINFSHNNLQGQLPDSLGDLRSLQVFDVSRNNISGKIPMSLSKINLTFLNLSFNDFNGIIPSGGIFNSFTNMSFLGNPSLCGVASSTPICPHKKHWFRSRMFLVIFVIIIVVSVLLSTVCCMIGIRHIKLMVSSRKIEGSRRKSAALKITQNFPRLTYKELSDATGGFDEHKLIGTGSYGRVYKGVLPDDTSIAVKVLHLQSGNSIKSFNRECQVLKRIRHRNLIRIITACSLPDFKALVLPYMANGSLDSRLYPHSESGFSDLTLTQRVSICSDIAEGMAYLHHHSPVRVIHCDLKPSNVLLNDDMTALVSDFGIARLVTTAGNGGGGGGGGAIDNMGTSTANILTGSVGYIAPEYGFGSNTSFRGDVYSFGVVVLEMVTRKRPTDDMFVGGLNLQKWVKNHYHGRLEKVVDSCLVSDSRDQSAEVKRMWEVAIEELIELGILCTQETPSNRPTMLDAADDLDRLKRYLSGDSTVTFASSLGISSSTLSND